MRPALLALARWNLRASLRWWQPLATLTLFGLLGWWGAAQALGLVPAPAQASVWDGFFVAWAGPSIQGFSLSSLLFWFVPHLLFCYSVGDLANGELSARGYALLPRIGGRARWWWGKLALLGWLACGYTLLAAGATLLGSSLVVPFSWRNNIAQLLDLPRDIASTALLAWVLLLFGSTLFTLAAWQTLCAVAFRHSFGGLIVVIGVLLASAVLGTNNPQLVRWLPGSQSMLLRHTFLDSSVSGFSLAWSLLYNAALLLVAIVASHWYVAQCDIFGPSSNER